MSETAAPVLSEAEVAIAKAYNNALKVEREAMEPPTIEDMVAALESEIDAHATAARVSIGGGLPHPVTALRRVVTLDAAINLLRMIEPKRKEVWRVIRGGAAR